MNIRFRPELEDVEFDFNAYNEEVEYAAPVRRKVPVCSNPYILDSLSDAEIQHLNEFSALKHN